MHLTALKNTINYFKFQVLWIIGMLISSFLFMVGSPYQGRQKIYKIIQGKKSSLATKSLKAYYSNDFELQSRNLKKDIRFLEENLCRDRLSDRVVEIYSGDSLDGYGDTDFQKDIPFLDQQRALCIPLIKDILKNNAKIKKIIEIGTGNGDVIGFLAKEFPNRSFLGIDFSVKNAGRTYKNLKNVIFKKGYALDFLQKKEIEGDLIIFNSTLGTFTELEYCNYFKHIQLCGFNFITVNEPFWSFFEMNVTSKVFSQHLEGSWWFHNHPKYFEKFGFQVMSEKVLGTSYLKKHSTRPDNKVYLASAVRLTT